MRGRKPKPTALHVLDGTYRPDRHGPLSPAAAAAGGQGLLLPELGAELPKPPAQFRGALLTIWKQTVRLLSDLGILDAADQGILAMYCEARYEMGWAMAELRKHGRLTRTAAGGIKPHPAVAIKNAAALRCAKFAAELGLTPTARARLRLGQGFGDPDPGDEDSDLD